MKIKIEKNMPKRKCSVYRWPLVYTIHNRSLPSNNDEVTRLQTPERMRIRATTVRNG